MLKKSQFHGWKKSLFFVKKATHSLCGIKRNEKNCIAKNLKALAHDPPLLGEKKKKMGMKPRGKKKTFSLGRYCKERDNKVWDLLTTFFCKVHKSKRVCEGLFNVAK